MKPQLMSPAGSWESLRAAIKAGTNSIYFGIKQLNMRSHGASNFDLKDLKKITEICNKENIKTYLTLNTIVYDKEIKLIKKICNKAKETGITSIIASDLSIISYCNSIKLPVNISTQLNVSNIDEIKFFSKYADTITLARELNLDQIKNITKQIKKEKIKGPSKNLIKIEVFIHGALCVSISGKCYMSLATHNKSANRGECLQNCRRTYKVTDNDTNDELKIKNKYVMSPKDLCTIGIVDKLIKAGISIFKIEGRARSPDYVYTVTKTYKEAIDSINNKTYSKDKIKTWEKELKTVFNRGFWNNGYYLGKKLGEWANSYGNKATKKKKFIGICLHYFTKKKIGYFNIQTSSIKLQDEILITGPTTGIVKEKINSIVNEKKSIEKAKKGDLITIPIKEKIRKNDKLFLIK
tara:strand:- start:5221 stop:6447 length:1227 start_codon:yes stop_codon:yes gene_type:complete